MTRPTIKDLTGKNSLSYSSLDSFTQCGEKYRLTRIQKVPTEQAWWFAGGSAFHSATEMWDKGDDRGTAAIWAEAFDKEIAGLDLTKNIRAGGRASKANPNKEDREWWNTNGLLMLINYVDWRETSDWQIVDINGVPLIEYEFFLNFPNPIKDDGSSPEIVLQGFIDRVFVNGNGELVITDLKTGSRTPASTLQLGIYSAGLRQRLGMDATLGSYYMARDAAPSQERSLHLYTDEYLARILSAFEDSVRRGYFIPNVTSMCASCEVQPHCYIMGGNSPAQASSNNH